MIEFAKKECNKRGVDCLRLDCAFYERMGFVKVDERMILDLYLTAFYECMLGS